jgi:hypothetical protein
MPRPRIGEEAFRVLWAQFGGKDGERALAKALGLPWSVVKDRALRIGLVDGEDRRKYRQLGADEAWVAIEGRSAEAAAKVLGVSENTIWNWRRKFREAGLLAPQRPGRKPRVSKVAIRCLARLRRRRSGGSAWGCRGPSGGGLWIRSRTSASPRSGTPAAASGEMSCGRWGRPGRACTSAPRGSGCWGGRRERAAQSIRVRSVAGGV